MRRNDEEMKGHARHESPKRKDGSNSFRIKNEDTLNCGYTLNKTAIPYCLTNPPICHNDW